MKPIIRCSSLSQLLKCHGSRTIIERVKPRGGNEAYEGTFIHWRTAKDLIEHMGAEGTVPDWPHGVPRTYKLPRQSEWLINWFVIHAKETIPDDWSLEVENELRWEFDRFILVGHHDLLATNLQPGARKTHGADWKSVYNAVPPAAQNDQVLGYLVLEHLNYDTDESSFDIEQPRVKPEDGEKSSTVTLNRAQLQKAVAYLESAINAALDDPYTTDDGPTQCAFCAGALQCPSIQLEIEKMKATLTPELLARLAAEPDDALLGDIVVAAKILKKPFEDAGEMIRDRLAAGDGRVNAGNGTSITMELRAGKYSVKEGQEMEVLTTVQSLIPPAEFAKVINYSTDELKQAIARTRGIPQDGKSPTTAKKVFIEQIAPMMEQGQSRVLKYA
jgi:hypothetical protein